MDRKSLIADLLRDEGLRLKPYKCTSGKLTIGVGRNIEDIGISEQEALVLLNNDIDRVFSELQASCDWFVKLSDNRKRALANMEFNLGISRFLEFEKMLSAIENSQFDRAADEAVRSRWAKQVGSRAHRIATLIREG